MLEQILQMQQRLLMLERDDMEGEQLEKSAGDDPQHRTSVGLFEIAQNILVH